MSLFDDEAELKEIMLGVMGAKVWFNHSTASFHASCIDNRFDGHDGHKFRTGMGKQLHHTKEKSAIMLENYVKLYCKR